MVKQKLTLLLSFDIIYENGFKINRKSLVKRMSEKVEKARYIVVFCCKTPQRVV